MPFFDDSRDFAGKHWNDPSHVWESLPTYLVGQLTFFIMAIAALVHAIANGRMHILAFAIALLGGVWTDIFYMELPMVNSFWHAQGLIMLTPRLPLYIPCVYITFVYFATVIPWRLNIPLVSQVCYSGLLGRFIYAPYDAVGPVFLWWTWHTSDNMVLNRNYGAPASSTVFTSALCAAAPILLAGSMHKSKSSSPWSLTKGFIGTVGPLPIMMAVLVNVALLLGDQEDWQRPTHRSVIAADFLCTIGFVYGLISPPTNPSFLTSRHLDGLMNMLLALYFCVFIGSILYGNSEDHVSLGVHQELGPCETEDALPFPVAESWEPFILRRKTYVCAETVGDADLFRLDCGNGTARFDADDAAGNRWYTVCGAPFDRKSYLVPVVGYGFIALSLITFGLSCNTRPTARSRVVTNVPKTTAPRKEE